jgi:hypothetical protein
LNGLRQPGPPLVTDCCWETTADAEERRAGWLRDFEKLFRCLPQFNREAGAR